MYIKLLSHTILFLRGIFYIAWNFSFNFHCRHIFIDVVYVRVAFVDSGYALLSYYCYLNMCFAIDMHIAVSLFKYLFNVAFEQNQCISGCIFFLIFPLLSIITFREFFFLSLIFLVRFGLSF